MQQVAVQDPCFFCFCIAFVVLCAEADEGLADVLLEPNQDEVVEYGAGGTKLPCLPCEVVPQHSKSLGCIEHLNILLWNLKRTQFFTLLAQHGDL